jgi:RNA polymerase sigma-70 factor (ECF subfamily)
MGREEFENIFRRYSMPLFYYAVKFVDDEEARDIVQDVFVKLWKAKNLTVHTSLNSLLFTMVRNKCLQHIEKEKVRERYSISALYALREDELRFFSEGKTSLIEEELENKLNEILDALPPRCKQVFMMSRFENKKNKEIAEELGISLKAVEKQITLSLCFFREKLKSFMTLVLIIIGSILK